MNFRRNKFKILLPTVCIVATALPVIGLIITIAEGPNPFGFLFPLSLPAFYLLDVLSRFFPVPNLNGWLLMLLGVPINLLLYFLLGCLLDYTVNRMWANRE
jgi:hypothetical protein